MELELQRIQFEEYQLIVDTVAAQETTTESIVPDAFPDISRVISAEGNAGLTAKQVSKGCAKMMGTAEICVLYIPEGESAVRSLQVQIPFQAAADDPKIRETDCLHCTILSVNSDARLLNPRKLLIQTEVRLCVKIYSTNSRELVSDITAQDDGTLQRQCQQVVHHTISAVVEKQFQFSDTLRQPASKPPLEELLTYSVAPATIDVRCIGKKLVCKGELALSALCRTDDGLHNARFELPFSQIIDLEGGSDEGNPDASLCLRQTECVLHDGELTVTVDALLQASLWSRKEITLLRDAYSTAVPLEVERTAQPLCVTCEHETRKESGRKFCESSIPAKLVLDCSVVLDPVITRQTDTSTEAETEAAIRILYLSEDDALCAVNYGLPLRCALEAGNDIRCRCTCRPVGEVTAAPVTGGFEVRMEAEFLWFKLRSDSFPQVAAIRQGKVTGESEPSPSVIIRPVCPNEALWDLAKACNATIDDICQVNDLPSPWAAPGTILLIPAKR